MSVNPYEPPRSTSPRSPRKGFAIRLLRQFPATFALLVVATVIGGYLAAKEYHVQAIMSREGSYSGSNSQMDLFINMLGLPGLFSIYVVVTFTDSMVLGCTAYVLGMAFAYGIPGMMLDLLWRLFKVP